MIAFEVADLRLDRAATPPSFAFGTRRVLPTLPGQADIMQARWGSHGDHPIIVLSPASVEETLYLTINDDRGCALWRSDGTATGTVAIHRSCPWEMVSVNGTLFFTLPGGEQKVQLWKSDSTTEGTVLVKSPELVSSSSEDSVQPGSRPRP